MNSEFIVARARGLVARLEGEAGDVDRIRLAYRLLYGRLPSKREIQIGVGFVAEPVEGEQLPGWVQYAQALLSSNEFMYVR